MPHPIYYCPPEIPRPAHIRDEAANGLMPTAGPDGLGGFTFGGAWHPDDLYHQTPAGWWVHLRGTTHDLLRRDALPDGIEVNGWWVPRLLSLTGTPTVGYIDVTGFVVPARFVDVTRRLQGVLEYAGPILPEHARLAADILAINYHITLHELSLLECLTPASVVDIWLAACSVHPGRRG